jgi:hypothetical protein
MSRMAWQLSRMLTIATDEHRHSVGIHSHFNFSYDRDEGDLHDPQFFKYRQKVELNSPGMFSKNPVRTP